MSLHQGVPEELISLKLASPGLLLNTLPDGFILGYPGCLFPGKVDISYLYGQNAFPLVGSNLDMCRTNNNNKISYALAFRD